MNWYGWLRRDRRHKWERVCGPYSTIGECSRQLGIELAKRGLLERYSCMTTGACPRDTEGNIDAENAALHAKETP
jgi:hypothetical protein